MTNQEKEQKARQYSKDNEWPFSLFDDAYFNYLLDKISYENEGEKDHPEYDKVKHLYEDELKSWTGELQSLSSL